MDKMSFMSIFPYHIKVLSSYPCRVKFVFTSTIIYFVGHFLKHNFSWRCAGVPVCIAVPFLDYRSTHVAAATVLQVNSVEPDMTDCKRFSGKPVTEKIVQYYRVRTIVITLLGQTRHGEIIQYCRVCMYVLCIYSRVGRIWSKSSNQMA